MNHNATIDVVCCVFADGAIFWTDDVVHGPKNALDAWHAALAPGRYTELIDANALSGFVRVRMLRKDYAAIGAQAA